MCITDKMLKYLLPAGSLVESHTSPVLSSNSSTLSSLSCCHFSSPCTFAVSWSELSKRRNQRGTRSVSRSPDEKSISNLSNTENTASLPDLSLSPSVFPSSVSPSLSLLFEVYKTNYQLGNLIFPIVSYAEP